MPLGEVFLGAFLQVLFDRLATPHLLNLAHPEGLPEKLNKWQETLSVIKTVLDDAEEKQHDDAGIKKWLDDLRDVAFDLEDIMNEFDAEALRRKLVGENLTSSSKAWNPISALFTCLTPSSSTLRLKIAEITERFDNIAALKDQLDLKGKVDGSSNRRRSKPEPPTSVVNEASVFGRETDVEAVLKLFPVEVRKPGAELTVIPIQGMGGLGKTTLAQLVYNDEKVEKFFELKSWACVSEDFDVAKVTKSILECHTSDNCDGKDLNWLQKNLKEKLQGKRFLVILDDLWNEKYDKWTVLLSPFAAGAPGSTIIITTRNQAVSSMVRTTNIAHHLLPLSDESCLSILIHHALGTRDFSAHSHLETVGKEIARKCKGSPLAAKTLGGLLRNAKDSDEWEEVLKSNIWDIPPEKSEIVPALMLSYHHLPSELKRCFAYCSIFPKDYEFAEEELVLLWMAEGFVQPREKEKQMEELGKEYFQNLVSRSFFQQSTSNESRYLMHDLINDLAQYVAGDTCFRMEDRIYGTKEGNVPIKARHSSYLSGQYDGAKKFEALSHCTCLRTFLPLMLPELGECYLTCDVPLQLLPKLRCLRVLSLRGYRITKISDSIGELKQLRYLDLSYTAITSMPESTTTLYNLQTLLFEECRKLVKLPSTFANLVNLRHLNVLGADSLEGLPPQIGKLIFLRMLSNLVLGKESCSGIKELGSLSNLRGTLYISGLENVIEPRGAWEANLSGKCNLSGLVLEWSGKDREPQDRRKDLEVLNRLQPQKNLKEFTFRHYGGTEFPTWLRGASFPNMVLLRIENCKWCPSLHLVGQLPSLKFLFIKGMARVKSVGMEFYGKGCSQPFRSLETLHFENMEEWENWSPCEEFPSLRELSIDTCPMLSGELPKKLPLLESIEVTNCARLVVSISRLPALSKITIRGCKGLVCRNNDDFCGLLRFADLEISESASKIEGLIDVEDLFIDKCEELMPLWSNKEGFLHLSRLRELTLWNCDKLVSLVANETCLPSTLRVIRIHNCSALKHLPKAMMYNNTCLESILIHGCHSLRYFARGQLPQTPRNLYISDCKNMQIVLVEEEEGTNSRSSRSASLLLEDLYIIGCPSLESLTSSGELPATLKHLDIRCCQKLESIAKSLHRYSFLETIHVGWCKNLKALPTGIYSLSLLRHLHISHCPNLVPFPDGEREFLTPNLTKLFIFGWEKLQGFPIGIHNLTSLQELTISRCPGISSFWEDTLPNNLTSLEISHLEITEILLESGLHRLTSLKELLIDGGCPYLVSFPTPEMMLPASLTSLSIASFPNLQNLSSEGLRRLASLEELSIGECEKLTSFPEDGLPPSLLKLHIDACRKLSTFPKNGLPPSLLQLCIKGCPLLEENCKKYQGREWSKIANIPCVYIDRKFVYDP